MSNYLVYASFNPKHQSRILFYITDLYVYQILFSSYKSYKFWKQTSEILYFLGKIDFRIFYRIIRSESGSWIEKFNETIISAEFAELFIMMPDIN